MSLLHKEKDELNIISIYDKIKKKEIYVSKIGKEQVTVADDSRIWKVNQNIYLNKNYTHPTVVSYYLYNYKLKVIHLNHCCASFIDRTYLKGANP